MRQRTITAFVQLRPPDLADNCKSEHMIHIINILQYFLQCTVPKGLKDAGAAKLGAPVVSLVLSTSTPDASAQTASKLKAFSGLLSNGQNSKLDALATAMAHRSRSDAGEAARKRQNKGPPAPSKGEAHKATQECLNAGLSPALCPEHGARDIEQRGRMGGLRQGSPRPESPVVYLWLGSGGERRRSTTQYQGPEGTEFSFLKLVFLGGPFEAR